jgi:hypothetical protein
VHARKRSRSGGPRCQALPPRRRVRVSDRASRNCAGGPSCALEHQAAVVPVTADVRALAAQGQARRRPPEGDQR